MVNEKGQAFSVFKILIAGIVALAMLGILLPLLNIQTIQNDPSEVASSLVQKALGSRYTLVQSEQKALFDTDSELVARSISAKNRSILENQVCIVPGKYDSEGSNLFSDSATGSFITYTSSQSRDLKIAAICAEGTEIEDALDQRAEGTTSIANDIRDHVQDQVAVCDCISSSEICCVVFPIAP
jgi:hypothetical protein